MRCMTAIGADSGLTYIFLNRGSVGFRIENGWSITRLFNTTNYVLKDIRELNFVEVINLLYNCAGLKDHKQEISAILSLYL